MRKAEGEFRIVLSQAVMCGNGVGKLVGILNPASGIPVCDTSANRPPDQFTAQDVIQLKFPYPSSMRHAALILERQDARSGHVNDRRDGPANLAISNTGNGCRRFSWFYDRRQPGASRKLASRRCARLNANSLR
jgi:hypothetical protein